MIQKQCQSIVFIQYHRNVSMNSQWISINTNSILLGSLSSPTLTVRETSEMACNSAITVDATSGREQLWKKCFIEYMCVQYPCAHM